MATRSEDETRTGDAELDDTEPADLDEGVEEEVLGVDDDDDVAVLAEDADDTDDDEVDGASEGEDALNELETEELEMLTEDEANETLAVDEAAEMRALRRAELAMSFESPSEAREDEFVCQSCFLVKRATQLADKRRKWCTDCAG